MSKESKKKILFYSPYGRWYPHTLWEITIAHAIKIRGHDVRFIACDGIYPDCDVHWAATAPREEGSCQMCMEVTSRVFSGLDMRFQWVGGYLNEKDRNKAAQWSNSIDVCKMFDAFYDRYPLGERVKSSVHSHFRMNHLDLGDKEISTVYRNYLHGAALATQALGKILDSFEPDVLVMLNGRFFSHRVALELAKERSVRGIVHERGRYDNSLMFFDHDTCHSLNPIQEIWKKWKDSPLSKQELAKIHQHFEDRRRGKNTGWNPYTARIATSREMREKPGISDKKIITLFASSDDEIAASKAWGETIFSTQTEWIKETISWFQDRSEYHLIIRLHPNTDGEFGTNIQFMQKIEKLIDSLPSNVSVIMPRDQIDSYALMEISVAGLTYGSTAGFEMAAMGLPVVCARQCHYYGCDFVYSLDHKKNYHGLLDQVVQISRSDKIRRLAYRFAYHYFFSLSIPMSKVSTINYQDAKINYRSVDELAPGKDKDLDRIADFIVSGKSLYPDPSECDHEALAKEEEDFFRELELNPDETQKPASAANSSKPQVSVIIPAYNKNQYIKKTIDSVLEQSNKHIEVIVVDDGSTDNTAGVVKSYGDFVKYLYKENDGLTGPGSAINLGIANSQGKFVHCLDADDKVMPDFYKKVLDKFEEDSSLGAVCADAYQIDEKDTITNAFKLGYFRNMNEFALEALHHDPVVSSTMVIKRECYEKVGLRKPEFEIADDYELWLRISEHYPIAHLHEPLIYYRVYDLGISRDIEKTKKLDEQIVTAFRQRHDLSYFFPQMDVENDPDSRAKASKLIGDLLFQRERYQLAKAEYRVSLESDPNQPEILARLSEINTKLSGSESSNVISRTESASQGRKLAKVLFVVHNFPPHWFAGVEIYTYQIAKILKSKNIDISVLYPVVLPGIESPTLKEDFYDGIKVYKILTNDLNELSRHVENRIVEDIFEKLLEAEEFDLIHFQHTHKHLPFSLLNIAKGKDLPVCLTLHDFWFICPKAHLYSEDTNKICKGPSSVDKCVKCCLAGTQEEIDIAKEASTYYLMAYRFRYVRELLSKIDKIASPSKFLARKFKTYGFGDCRIDISPLGLNFPKTKRLQSKSKDTIRFGFIGTIWKLKNVDFLARAFKSVEDEATLTFWGYGIKEDVDNLRKVISDDTRINYKGSYSYEMLPEILADLDVVVVPSLFETYSLVVREALSANVPVIASKLGGVPEAIFHMKNGILFDPYDQQELTDWLQKIVDNPEIVEQLKGGIAPVKTLEQDAEEWISRYSELIKQKQSKEQFKCSVVIPACGGVKHTKQCIEAVSQNTPENLYEAIIVDNMSCENTKEFLSTLEGDIKIINNETEVDMSTLFNQGAKAAGGKYLVFLDNDVQPNEKWLEEMLRIVEQGTNIAVVDKANSLLFHREVFLEAGMFNTKSIDPFEDQEIYQKVKDLGYQVSMA